MIYGKSGPITLDLGYKNTGATKAPLPFWMAIEAFFAIAVIALKSWPPSQLFEVAYLLIFGELPKKEELTKFTEDIKKHTLVHEDVKKILDGFPSAPSDGRAGFSVLLANCFLPWVAWSQPVKRKAFIWALFGHWPRCHNVRSVVVQKMPWASCKLSRQLIGLLLALHENDVHVAAEDYHADPVVADARQTFDLHTDHEQNCSYINRARIVGSSLKSQVFILLSRLAFNALWPLHGGANQEVIVMLRTSRKGGKHGQLDWKSKDKSDPFRPDGLWPPCL